MKFCAAHEQCELGYCLLGRCQRPSQRHDPCNLENGSSCAKVTDGEASRFTCSPFSHTCVEDDYVVSGQSCASPSDCSHAEFCAGPEHGCMAKLNVGDVCKAHKHAFPCISGSTCYEAHPHQDAECRRSCIVQNGNDGDDNVKSALSPGGCLANEYCKKLDVGVNSGVCLPRTGSDRFIPISPIIATMAVAFLAIWVIISLFLVMHAKRHAQRDLLPGSRPAESHKNVPDTVQKSVTIRPDKTGALSVP